MTMGRRVAFASPSAAESTPRRCHVEEPQRLRPRWLELQAKLDEDLRRDTSLLAQQAEEKVFRADIAVTKLVCLGHR
jgi:hypothetical protein